MSDLQLQQYLFDVQGYLVIENVLSPDELAALNQCIDDQHLPTPGESSKIRKRAGWLRFPAVGVNRFAIYSTTPRLCRYSNSD